MEVRAPPLPSRYRGALLVGRGGMADVFHAHDVSLGREVAVKVLSDRVADDEEIRARFLREGIAGARLSGGPHTISVYDVGELDGRPFIVMEHVPGGSLADRLQRGPVPEPQALLWLEQAARALDAAHASGVVHRDVKPANLLLDAAGNVRVADFGIARADGLDSNTQTGVVLGTLGYLAPELAAGAAATAASDQYALAVVAHELLTGSRPGASGSRRLSPAADAALSRALSGRPDERFGSCAGFVRALRRGLVAGDAAPVPVPRHRGRLPVLTAGAVALGLLGYVLVWGLDAGGGSLRPPTQPRPVAVRVTVPASPATQPAAERHAPPLRPAAVRPTPAAGAAHGHGPGHAHGRGDGAGRGDNRGHGRGQDDG